MKIEYLNPEGVHAVEKEALSVIAEALPNEWCGYASLEMLDRWQGNAEIDLVIITDVRVIVVELKRINGELTSDGQYWYKNNNRLYRSPVKATELKAKKLRSKIEKKLRDRLPKIPWVDSCVVIYGSANKKNIPEDERDFVFTLDDFILIASPNKLYKYFNITGSEKNLPKEHKPNASIKIWNQFFGKNKSDFKGAGYSVNNYVISGEPLFKHPDGIYREYFSQRTDDKNYKALMRRWDFSASSVADVAQTIEERCLIGFRESKVLGYIDSQDEELKNLHLGILYVPDPTDVTEEFVELYDWPNNRLRLDEFINRNRGKLSAEKRVEILQVFVSQIARLHEIDVAHRDIGKHSVWVDLPARVTLSNFVTSSYPDPDKKTVRSYRDLIKVGQIQIPEDLYDDIEGTSYTRDVYLAGACAHYIAFDRWPRKDSEGVYVWEPVEPDPYGGNLDDWFARMLDLSAGSRFSSMKYALDELNNALLGLNKNDNAIESFNHSFYSDCNVWQEYAPTVLGQVGTAMHLRSSDGALGIKIWNGVSQISNDRTINHQLSVFLKRMQSLKNSSLASIPGIERFGYNPNMQYVFVAYRWREGASWSEWVGRDISEELLIIAMKRLLTATIALHNNKFVHGDIHPDNVIICEHVGSPEVSFIDMFEYSNAGREPYNPHYIPTNHENLSAESVDRYAVVKIVAEAAAKGSIWRVSEYANDLLKMTEISAGELARFLDAFDEILSPRREPTPTDYQVLGARIPVRDIETLESDDGTYYVTIKLGRDDGGRLIVKAYIAGVSQQLDLYVDPIGRTLGRVYYKNSITHGQFIRNKRNSDAELKGKITLARGAANEADGLVHWLLDHPFVRKTLRESHPELQDQYREKLSITRRSRYGTRDLWAALVETEHEVLPKVVVDKEIEILPSNEVIVYYTSSAKSLEVGGPNDTILVKKVTPNGVRVLGRVIDRGRDALRISLKRGAASITVGDELRLESSMASASLSKRQKAVDALLKGRCLIENITDYFDLNAQMTPIEMAVSPTDEQLDVYNEYDSDGKLVFALNRQQRDAFRLLYKMGPVSLLQGPPGTGKTAFISSFIHFILTGEASRILLVSQSHEAVNNAAERVRGLFEKQEKLIGIVRLGDDANVSDSLKDVHELALQDYYRERFRAEYKPRLRAAAANLGLPEQFLDNAIEFECSFGKNIYAIKKAMESLEDGGDKLSQRVNNLKAKLVTYWKSRHGIDMPLGDDLDSYREQYYFYLATTHDVMSPALIDKFRQLVQLSSEWLTVMASKNANFQNFLVRTKSLVCGTCVGVARQHYGITENVFDWVIIDEAARSSPSELAIAMQVGRRILLVGDHMQLPPLYEEEHVKAVIRKLPGMDDKQVIQSDFERGFISEYGKQVGQTLLTQYRMAPGIGQMVSDCFYGTLLETGRGEPEEWVSGLPGTEITWVDTADVGPKGYESAPESASANVRSKVNDYEIRIISSLVEKIVNCKSFQERYESYEGGEPPIGIVCMYGEQAYEMIRHFNRAAWSRNLIENRIVKIDTVDSYQGKENPIIIVSVVRNNPKQNIGFLSESRSSSNQRVNVAISRAKERLYVVGSSAMFSERNASSAVGKILTYIKSNVGTRYSIQKSSENRG